MIFPYGGYRPHQAFFAPAKAKSELWLTILGITMIAAIYFGLLVALVIYLRIHYGAFFGAFVYAAMARGSTPGSTVLLLFSFLAMAIAVFSTTRLLHQRSAATLFGRADHVFQDCAWVGCAVLALHFAFLPVALGYPNTFRNLDFATFAIYFPFAFVALLVQVGAEELLFRGYLQQQLAARFRSPLIWMFIPSSLFAAMHYSADYGSAAWLVVAWAWLFGLCASDLTARTGSLGAAIGLHFANNFAAFFLIGIRGDLSGLSLWSVTVDPSDPQMVPQLIAVDILTLLTSWLIARLALRL